MLPRQRSVHGWRKESSISPIPANHLLWWVLALDWPFSKHFWKREVTWPHKVLLCMNLEIKTNGLLDWCLFLFTSQVWRLERTPFSLVADMRKKITFTTSCGKRCKQKVIFITSIQPFLETKNAQAVWDALIHQDAHFYVSGCVSHLLCPKWVILTNIPTLVRPDRCPKMLRRHSRQFSSWTRKQKKKPTPSSSSCKEKRGSWRTHGNELNATMNSSCSIYLWKGAIIKPLAICSSQKTSVKFGWLQQSGQPKGILHDSLTTAKFH